MIHIHVQPDTRIATLAREVEAMRRVVEAAERWLDLNAGVSYLDARSGDLVRAVDEYRARTTG